MRLKCAKFKDYYDYLVHQLRDDHYTYDRSEVGGIPTKYFTDTVESPLSFSLLEGTPSWPELIGTERYYFARLVVGDTHYLVHQSSTKLKWKITVPGCEIPLPSHSRLLRVASMELTEQQIVEIYNTVKQPVFIIRYPERIERRIPILAKLGAPAILTPEQIYQKLERFFSLGASQETQSAQTNAEKIVGHGFDLKTSFRGNIRKRF